MHLQFFQEFAVPYPTILIRLLFLIPVLHHLGRAFIRSTQLILDLSEFECHPHPFVPARRTYKNYSLPARSLTVRPTSQEVWHYFKLFQKTFFFEFFVKTFYAAKSIWKGSTFRSHKWVPCNVWQICTYSLLCVPPCILCILSFYVMDPTKRNKMKWRLH